MAAAAPPPPAGAAPAGRRSARRRRIATAALSFAGHAAIVLAVLSAHRDPPRFAEPEAMSVQLVEVRPPPEAPPQPEPPAPARPAPPKPKPAKPAPPKPPSPHLARAARTPAPAAPLPAGKDAPADTVAELSDAQVAGAATAGSGPPGRPCDMTRRLQAALRRDARVQAAVADAHRATGKAMLVWNGDWIRSQGQDGNGLAAVREAIMWEVGFAPEACRAEPVHGLVLISLDDRAGAARLVVGSGEWRWSDLLRPRRGG